MGHLNTAAPSGPTVLLADLSTLVDGVGTKEPQVEIVEEELGNALRTINFRIDKTENISALTTGEPGGEYFPVGQALQASIKGKDLQLRNYASAGSVDNCALVENHMVDFALVQNDIAAMAYGGDGIFADRGSMGHLRALASLFPEPIQVVTLKSSGLSSIMDLKGKKIDIGLPKSGSQVNAMQILEAHGLALSDFAEVTEKGFAESIEALKSGAVDAFFVTLAAPSGQLQRLSSADPIRLLSMDPEAREKLLSLRPYYVPLTLPANTYPGQDEAVQTLSVTAMLITHQETPDAKVEELLGGLFQNIDAIARQSFQASVISRKTARDGISIPLHPAAERYYAQ
jgi:TRAP transporter TAXI family solute receptor